MRTMEWPEYSGEAVYVFAPPPPQYPLSLIPPPPPYPSAREKLDMSINTTEIDG
jgi:hypothetical protein